jgi:hypothetical protein
MRPRKPDGADFRWCEKDSKKDLALRVTVGNITTSAAQTNRRDEMTTTAYIIRSENTGNLIEAHDEISLQHAKRMIETHNSLYPADQWVMTEEQL